eukprot:3080200-Pyramimonas_sp.AAC.1
MRNPTVARWPISEFLEEGVGNWASEAVPWSPNEARSDWNMWCVPLADMTLRRQPQLRRLWSNGHKRRVMTISLCDRLWYLGHRARHVSLRRY